MYLKQTSKTILKIIYLMFRMQIRDVVEEWYFTYSKMSRTLSFFNENPVCAVWGLRLPFSPEKKNVENVLQLHDIPTHQLS